ncbi:MAG: selenium cofactor biosynthesis protein YqeC [Pseudomonadota bacterium]
MNGFASLITSFRLGPPTRLATIVGAGGKTSLMYAAAADLFACGLKVVTTTTTKIFPPDVVQSSRLIMGTPVEIPDMVRKAFTRFGNITVGSGLLPNGKVDGVSEDTIRGLLEIADIVLVEGDGASGRPVKAPEAWEPVIPSLTDIVVPVVGLDCLGKPADPSIVFRLHRFLAVTGLRQGAQIGPQNIACLLGSADGGLKGIPAGAMVIPFLNKIDQVADESVAGSIARQILHDAGNIVTRVVSGSAAYNERFTIHERP